MSLPFFYTEQMENMPVFTLNEDTSRHMVQVLRMVAGEQVKLTDGKGNYTIASIIDSNKKKCTVRIIERKTVEKKAKEVSVAISLLKNSSRFEWFLEKATEIGVTDIVPLISERTYKQTFRYERMNSILIAAMLQSEQYWLPLLHQPAKFESIVLASPYTAKLIAHCESEQRSSLRGFEALSSQILIGPEGDFSKPEIALAEEKGYLPVTLGETRLRTETAGVVAATFLCI